MKTAKTFRLSLQALESLRFLVAETGANETAIVELALAYMKQAIKGKDFVPEPPPNFDDVPFQQEPVIKSHKHRKRHK